MTVFADVSHYQTVDMATYFAAHDRVALKVTEGTGYVDPTFAPRYAYAVNHGLPTLLYHFDRARFTGVDQFNFYLATIRQVHALGPRPVDLLCLDSEDTNYPAGAAASARDFSNRGAALGYRGSQYTGVWYANPNGLTASVLHPTWRRLWLSDYGTTPDATVRLPNGWARDQAIARQFTDQATIAGVAGPADYSRVLHDWLPEITNEESDVTPDELQAGLATFFRAQRIDVPAGQGDNAGLYANTLGLLQTVYNRVNALASAVGALGDDETKLTALIVARGDQLSAAIATVAAAQGAGGVDPAVFADAVVDDLVRRLGGTTT